MKFHRNPMLPERTSLPERHRSELTLEVFLKPGSKRDRIVAVEGSKVTLSVSAPPVDGRANEAMMRFLSKILHIPKSSINLVTGHTSRHKIVRIGISDHDDALRKLAESAK